MRCLNACFLERLIGISFIGSNLPNLFHRSYASGTIDKDSKVQQLMKEKDERIIQLELELQVEKKNVNQQLQV